MKKEWLGIQREIDISTLTVTTRRILIGPRVRRFSYEPDTVPTDAYSVYEEKRTPVGLPPSVNHHQADIPTE